MQARLADQEDGVVRLRRIAVRKTFEGWRITGRPVTTIGQGGASTARLVRSGRGDAKSVLPVFIESDEETLDPGCVGKGRRGRHHRGEVARRPRVASSAVSAARDSVTVGGDHRA